MKQSFLFALCLVALLILKPAAFGQETEVQYLSGHDKDDTVPWKFLCTSGTNSGYWTNLPVPSLWDVKGFGTLHYQKDMTNAYDEQGLYEHEFTVPADWAAKRVFLVFDGAMTDTDAKLNGKSVGPVHQGAFYRFKYEVTSLVKFGETNLLEVTVAKHSANKSVNGAERNADYWVFGGIFRPVTLEAVPSAFIDHVAINALADGGFSANVFLDGITNLLAGCEIEAQIQTLDGHNVGEPFRASPGAMTLLGKSVIVSIAKAQVASPKLWTAETPNLYRVEIRLKQDGKVVHQVQQRFGFRTMEVRDGDGLYVNGKKVILKGADRHSFWPDSGRCLSETVHRLDINRMKDANMNAVRMSHYPPDAQFLDLCDELGLYVLDELGGWHHYYDDEVGPKLVKEMVERDVNHPCILFWDNGNEGGFNTNLDKLFDEYDPQQRRVLHPWAAFSGVNTAHYLAYDRAETAASGKRVYYAHNQELVDSNNAVKYIYMPTEFLHGLYDGGAGAGLADYWRMMMSHPLCAGGFIWALLDDGLKRPDTGEIDVVGNQAPDGILGPYRQREGSYFAIKEIWSPIQVTHETGDKFKVENHYSFTEARDCKFTWQLRKFPSVAATNSGSSVLREGAVESPDVPPGGTGHLHIPEIASRNADALALRVDDPSGRELWTWVWPLHKADDYRLTQEPPEHRAKPSENNGVIRITAGELTANFSKETGLLLGVQRGPQTYSLANGPRLAAGRATLRQLRFDDDGPDAFVSAKFDGNLKSILWRVSGNGWVNCNYNYSVEGTNDYFGVLFDYPESQVRHKRWLGNGPYRVWKNRLGGVTAGVWENDYNDTIAGWRGWIYPEFKGFFSDVRWLQLETSEGQITILNNNAVPFMQVLTPDFPPADLVGKAIAPMPKCGLAFLDGISPIGSKFKEARFGGPQGAPNLAHGQYTGSLSFYFGKLPSPAALQSNPEHANLINP